jgi:hypothetical protein
VRSGRLRVDSHHRPQQMLGSVRPPFLRAFEEHPCVSTPIAASFVGKNGGVRAKMARSFGICRVIPVLMTPAPPRGSRSLSALERRITKETPPDHSGAPSVTAEPARMA